MWHGILITVGVVLFAWLTASAVAVGLLVVFAAALAAGLRMERADRSR